MDGKQTSTQGGTQFNSADIGNKEAPEYFSNLKEPPLIKIKKSIKSHRKITIIIATSILVIVASTVGTLILINANKGQESIAEVESSKSISLSDDVASYLAGNYDGTYEELRQKLKEFIEECKKDGNTKSATLVILALADLQNKELYYQDSIDLLMENIETAVDDTTKVRLMGKLADTYGIIGLIDMQIEYLEKIVSYPDDAVHLDGESWVVVKMFYQAQLDDLKEQED